MDSLEVSQAWSSFKGLPPRIKTFRGYENKAERKKHGILHEAVEQEP